MITNASTQYPVKTTRTGKFSTRFLQDENKTLSWKMPDERSLVTLRTGYTTLVQLTVQPLSQVQYNLDTTPSHAFLP